MLFLRTALTVLIQTLLNESHYILGQYARLPRIGLSFPRNTVSIPILLDSIPGNVQRCCDLSLAHPLQPHLTYLFVNAHCYYHLFRPPIA